VSGFSADWLSLREPADHRARDQALVSALRHHLSGRDHVRLLDLGCGAGSNLRALAPALPLRQDWILVDHDPALLEAAQDRIDAWPGKEALPQLHYTLEQADLNAELERVLSTECDIVTAAALFDLVSRDWIDRFVDLLTRRGRPLYTVLTYDGQMRWQPPHPADDAVTAAFNAHQKRDKGLGGALGPDAAPYLAGALERCGYDVTTAPSPWRLGAEDKALMIANAEGVARAASETGFVPQADITDWLRTRSALEACEIGHTDLLALPK